MHGLRCACGAFAVVLLLVTGCQTVGLVPVGGWARERVVPGQLNDVALSTGAALRHIGMEGGGVAAYQGEDGVETMSVRGTTRDGREFTVVLRKTALDNTRARVVWDGQPDAELSRRILSVLTAKNS